MLTVDTATPQDVSVLAAQLAPGDAAELDAAGLTVESALVGVQAMAARCDGELIALFGAETHPASPGGGIPWMLCTSAIERAPRRAVALLADQVVSTWRERFDNLSNLVHRRNHRAIAFVRWLGFTVGTVPCGPGQEFFAFEWRRSDV